MRIAKIEAFVISPEKAIGGYGRQQGGDRAAAKESWLVSTEVANPMSVYPRFKAHRDSWRPRWPEVGCLITADDGSWGFGTSVFGAPVVSIINDHIGPLLEGEDPSDIDRLWTMMMRLVSPYGASGLPVYAVSAIDLALWDLKGKQEGVPVYDLIGGPARNAITCYATGNDTAWHMELGFTATKLACPHGPADGDVGLDANEKLVSETRDLIGPDVKLMLDCWMAFDVDYTLQMAERLARYDLGWLEDCLIPEDIEAHHELRGKMTDVPFATGEHWYGVHPFVHAARHQLADVFQPDICWAGGMTACLKIADIAADAGIDVILHAGMNTAYGQHFTLATAGSSMGELFIGSPPGVPLTETARMPGVATALDGQIVPANAPGFGLELSLEDISAMSS